MNSEIYKNHDTDFNDAYNLCGVVHTHEQLIEFLKSGNVLERHFAALSIDSIYSEGEGKIFVSNLTGQDGKVREAISFRLQEFLSNPKTKLFLDSECNYDKFLDAVTDINGNICRNVISSIKNLKQNEEFCNYFCPKLVELTLNLAHVVKQFGPQDGYKVNKECFKLYWCLETISVLSEKIKLSNLEKIINESKGIYEYTIREKCAKILSNLSVSSEILDKIRVELENDDNYYVRRMFK